MGINWQKRSQMEISRKSLAIKVSFWNSFPVTQWGRELNCWSTFVVPVVGTEVDYVYGFQALFSPLAWSQRLELPGAVSYVLANTPVSYCQPVALFPAAVWPLENELGGEGEEVGLNILYYQVKGKHPKGSKGNKVVGGGQRGLRLGWTWELELLVPLVCAQPFALRTVPALEHTTFNAPAQCSQPAFAHGICVYRHLCLKWVQAGKGREVCQSWDHLQSSNWKMSEFSDSLEPKSSVVFLQSPTACCFFKFYR